MSLLTKILEYYDVDDLQALIEYCLLLSKEQKKRIFFFPRNPPSLEQEKKLN